jgi:flavin-dependent dehydrogenase
MKIGIIGARLSGSYAAHILSSLGHEVLFFDPATHGEKACGGGITAKALATMPWFRDHTVPYSEIRTVELTTLDGCSAEVPLSRPIHIFSRAQFDETLRTAAMKAGARFYPERAIRFTPSADGWSIATDSGAIHDVDFLIGADGANSSVRARVAAKLAATDLSLALGHYVPGSHHPDKVIIVFQENGFHGYLWSFPRVDHASIGIIQRLPGIKAADLRRRVEAFIAARYPHAGTSDFFAARVPCLSRQTLATQRACGPAWALLGDAAGFVDAITSEGIYFALRSAELLGEAFRAGNPQSYEQRWRRDFGTELERAAAWRDRFYSGKFIRHSFTERVVRMIHGSTTVRRITDGVISGRLQYQHIRSRLLAQSPRILAETLRTIFSRA